MLECSACARRGGYSDESDQCPECRGLGTVAVTPAMVAQAGGFDVSFVFSAAYWADKGVLPVGGGLLDQPAWLIDAIEYLWAVQAKAWIAEMER